MVLKLETNEQLDLLINEKRGVFIYLYTPLCGTCKLARRFLSIIEDSEQVPPIYEADINFFKEKRQQWEVKSVPALLHLDNNNVIGKLYAFQSVTNVYEFVKRRNENEST
ncbi:thioredoxin family protein [Evansella cellulosilytica]|uniref:Thioredoxin-like protein n=1 Tax=Evansella cellulosilytica (strain ATCC 21833 / DSM 2522 / FERM P-1141 / JCM 9156 / N-4) TaxID=649639 RepID=E6U071_EVAC2|nr:thioredoxin family protein [Evansella cellulosilytica]ADU30187.1 thioredoxin-like protein [Evansella cellulosilytica DSM 2522]